MGRYQMRRWAFIAIGAAALASAMAVEPAAAKKSKMGCEIGLQRSRVQPDGLIADRDKRGQGLGLGTGEKRYLMSKLDECVGEVSCNTFGSAVQPGRNRLIKRGYLSNLHVLVSNFMLGREAEFLVFVF